MGVVNALLGRLFDFLLWPLGAWPPIVGLAVVSLMVAVGMLLIFRATSNQAKLAEVKRRIHASLFEIRLFNDDLRAILRAQVDILRHNASYVALSLVPLAWMIVPIVLVIAQLQFYYAYGGLEPGRPVLVKVTLDDAWASAIGEHGRSEPALALEPPPGIRVETPAVWIPSLREAAWRVAAERPGDYELTFRLGERTFTKSVRVSSSLGRRSPVRLERGLLNQILYPAEPPLAPDVPVDAVSVAYPERAVWLFGWMTHWMVVFFVLSLVFAFALRKRFDVVI